MEKIFLVCNEGVLFVLFYSFSFQNQFKIYWAGNYKNCKEIQPVHSEGDQPWDFFGRNDAKAETQVLWPPHVKSWLIGKDSDVGRDWGQEEKGTTEDEMAGWHHWLDGHESEWTPGDGEGQGGLARCDSWGCKESDTTERLNWTELQKYHKVFYVSEKVSKCVLKLNLFSNNYYHSKRWDNRAAAILGGQCWHKSFLEIIGSPTSGQTTNREGAQPQSSADNWIKGLLMMALPTRTRFSFPRNQSFPSGCCCC